MSNEEFLIKIDGFVILIGKYENIVILSGLK
jgi:hypothetical protein